MPTLKDKQMASLDGVVERVLEESKVVVEEEEEVDN